MRVLVACEESQAVTIEGRKLGHEVYSCDIVECSGGHPEWHIQQDVIPLLDGDCTFTTMDGAEHRIDGEWDMIIAFPPCTHLAVSGAAWFEKKRETGEQEDAIEFFMRIALARCYRIALENPVNIISGGYIPRYFPHLQQKYNFPIKPSQYVQPHDFGDKARKKTGFWLKNTPLLKPTKKVSPGDLVVSGGKTYSAGASAVFARDMNGKILAWNDPMTARIRSKTFPGMAKAIAEQWLGDNRYES